MKTTILIQFLYLLLLVTSCSLKETGSDSQVKKVMTLEEVLFEKQTEPVSLSLAIVDDISGSYTLNPESRDIVILKKFFGMHSGREILGYTNITEDSYTPILRWTSLSLIEDDKNKTVNPWIESEKSGKQLETEINLKIDSLNESSFKAFESKMKTKVERPVAMRSDVVSALKRATTFLNESPQNPKVMVVCSDFKDTYKQAIKFDKSIKLLIVGNVDSIIVKRCTGLNPTDYSVFESYEEAFNSIVQLNNSK